MTIHADDELRVVWNEAGAIYYVNSGTLTRFRDSTQLMQYSSGQFIAFENLLGVASIRDRIIATSKCQISVISTAYIRDLCCVDLDFAEIFYRFVSMNIDPISYFPNGSASVAPSPVSKTKLTNILGTESSSFDSQLGSAFPGAVGSVLKCTPDLVFAHLVSPFSILVSQSLR